MKKLIYFIILFVFLLPNAINAGEIHGDFEFGKILKINRAFTEINLYYDLIFGN